MESARVLSVGPAEAARLIGVSRTFFFGLLNSGAVASFKVGRKRLVRIVDLQAYVDRMAAEAARERAA